MPAAVVNLIRAGAGVNQGVASATPQAAPPSTTGVDRFTLVGSHGGAAPAAAQWCQGGWVCPGAGPGAILCDGGTFVSIIRVGLAETKHFAEGYEAIFGKKKDKKEEKDEKEESGAKSETGQKKKAAKKK